VCTKHTARRGDTDPSCGRRTTGQCGYEAALTRRVSAWSPYYEKDKILLERIQHKFTRMIPGFKTLSYEERLRKLDLWTLEERRNRADLLQVFKMYKGLSFSNFFTLSTVVNGYRSIRPSVDPPRVDPPHVRPKCCRSDPSSGTFHPRCWVVPPQHPISSGGAWVGPARARIPAVKF